jgi:branched-chain amino acid transport system permease protein
VLRVPLSEPLFVLGTLFILLVYFLPGGIVGALTARPRRGLRRLEASVRERPGVGVGEAP